MYPYLPAIGPLHVFHTTLGPFQPGTFGLMLWLAAVVAVIALQKNFNRHRVGADALNIVALAVIFGIIGAKTWHEMQNLRELRYSLEMITRPGFSHPLDVLAGFLSWFRDGFAWFGGLSAGIAVLMFEGHRARLKGPDWKSFDQPGTLGPRVGAIRMLDLATPAAAIGYGVGRIGCLLSGDGDYGINTTLPWGVHMAKNALVPPTPPTALVQPTPIYELLFSLALFWLLWQLGKRVHPVGWMTGVYLTLSGVGRFLVEFVRINPRLYFHHTMSNAQVAALASALLGFVVVLLAQRNSASRSDAVRGKPTQEPTPASS
ncbi:MAG TPA: prolipoprotein diacylglyceryl transferase family protein [Acidobacteriaceae bacterium]